MELDALDWPDVPAKMRPKPLFVVSVLTDGAAESMKAKGWAVTDLRLWPNTSMSERQALVLAWLEGLRVGSIQPTNRIFDVLELEAKTCGLTNLKQAPDKPKDLAEETVDAILDIKNTRPTRNK